MIIFNSKNPLVSGLPLFVKNNIIGLFKQKKFDDIENILLTADIEIKKWFYVWVNNFLDNIAQTLKASESEFYCEVDYIDFKNGSVLSAEELQIPETSIIYDRLALLHQFMHGYNIEECRKGDTTLYSSGIPIFCDNIEFAFVPTKTVLEESVEPYLTDLGFVVEII
jgi:hypothetical protein